MVSSTNEKGVDKYHSEGKEIIFHSTTIFENSMQILQMRK
jgi:hypothetical protein